MRIICILLVALGLSACTAHRGNVDVDGVGGVRWGDNSHHAGKGCPPGLAKQGRCW